MVVATMPSLITTNHKFQRFELIGDGVTDDTRAMQALFNGKDVYYKNTKIIARINNDRSTTIVIPNGTYYVPTKITFS